MSQTYLGRLIAAILTLQAKNKKPNKTPEIPGDTTSMNWSFCTVGICYPYIDAVFTMSSKCLADTTMVGLSEVSRVNCFGSTWYYL